MKKITQLLLMTMIWVCLSQFVNAQHNAMLNGVVTDVKGKPVQGASVSLFTMKDSVWMRSAITNDKGSYAFKDLPGTWYFISITNIGFEKYETNFFNLAGLEKYQCDTTRLLMQSKQLEAVVLSSGKRRFIETKLDKTVVNIEASPVAAGASVFEVLEKSPGVYSDKDGNLSMQGKSGVQVLLDGRPTYLSSDELSNMLKNMQSSEVQSIELITNPSAKYEAAGNAGIINIKTKKNMNLGTNGSLNTGVAYGLDPKANAGMNINNRSEKLNLFGNYNYSYNKNSRSLAIDREAVHDAISTYFTQDGTQYNESNTHRYKLGADYNPGKKSLLGFLVNGYESFEKQHAVNSTFMAGKREQVDSSLAADNNFKEHYSNSSYNLNFKSALNDKGDELAIDADYAAYSSNVNSLFRNYYYNSTMGKLKDPLLAKNNTHAEITIKSLKADYTRIFSNSLKLEAGAKLSRVRSDNELRYAVLKGTDWHNDTSKSNHFIYDENVSAAYLNASRQWEAISVQAGLRAEYSATKGNSLTDHKVVKRTYLDFFPAIFINKKITDSHNIGFSYSRRIQRPDYESLNPFVYIIDEYTYQKGNPFLKPEYNHSFELSYLLKNKYMAQMGYTTAKDAITDVILSDTANQALYQTSKNISQQKNYRLTISAPFQIGKNWKVSNNFSGIQMSVKSPDIEGKPVNASQFFVIMNSSHSFKVNDKLSLELDGKYTSPFLYGTLKLKSDFSLDAGLSQSVLHKKGNLKLSVSDFLNTKLQRVSSVYPGVNYSIRQKYETRIFRLNFTYSFGNRNVKESRSRQTGLEDEQSRLKAGSN